MSRTYSLLASYEGYNLALWIGQSNSRQPSGWHLYATKNHLAKLEAFLMLHKDANLRFIDDEAYPNEFVTVEGVSENNKWVFYPYTQEDLEMAKAIGLSFTECYELKYPE